MEILWKFTQHFIRILLHLLISWTLKLYILALILIHVHKTLSIILAWLWVWDKANRVILHQFDRHQRHIRQCHKEIVLKPFSDEMINKNGTKNVILFADNVWCCEGMLRHVTIWSNLNVFVNAVVTFFC